MRRQQHRWELIRKRRKRRSRQLVASAVIAIVAAAGQVVVFGARPSLTSRVLVAVVAASLLWLAACNLVVLVWDRPTPPFWWVWWAVGRSVR
jgi:hypothetical protein